MLCCSLLSLVRRCGTGLQCWCRGGAVLLAFVTGPAMRDRPAVQMKRQRCAPRRCHWSGDAGPACSAGEEAALSCSPLYAGPAAQDPTCSAGEEAALCCSPLSAGPAVRWHRKYRFTYLIGHLTAPFFSFIKCRFFIAHPHLLEWLHPSHVLLRYLIL